MTKQWKITRVYVVEAPGRSEAIEALRVAEQHDGLLAYLEYESVKEVEAPKRGWLMILKEQVAGR